MRRSELLREPMPASGRVVSPGRQQPQHQIPVRHDDRIIVHFDYDCFYAACFEVEDPELRHLPLAVQQKQIIVTCNYEARKRGLYKLQLITEAKKQCPDVIILLGEDLTRFRDHSKDNYDFLRERIWSGKAERLGFDEVFLDVTDMIEYNVTLVNSNDPANSWFCVAKGDPTRGFSFDATNVAGHSYPPDFISASCDVGKDSELALRLILASHLASHLRCALIDEKGFTSTVGISTNKELSKMVGNVHKPNAQTTLMPPYQVNDEGWSNVLAFLDDHEVGKVPGIGHKGAAKLRTLTVGYDVGYQDGLVTKFTGEKVDIRKVRTFPGIGPQLVEKILSGPGAPRDVGIKVWQLLHGVDDSTVGEATDVPKQISIEDTYLHVRDTPTARRKLILLATSLIRRLRIDLLKDDNTQDLDTSVADISTSLKTDEVLLPLAQMSRRWLAHPRTLRLSTRERQTQRSFGRTSRSGPMPNFIFSQQDSLESIAVKLTDECLMPMFFKMVSIQQGFDVFLMNVAATNMQESAGETGRSAGRDIGKMFKTQEKVLSEWRIADDAQVPEAEHPDLDIEQDKVRSTADLERLSPPPKLPIGESSNTVVSAGPDRGSEDARITSSQRTATTDADGVWQSDGGTDDADDGFGGYYHHDQSGVTSMSNGRGRHHGSSSSAVAATEASPCIICGALMPTFASEAHRRFHESGDG